MRVRLMCLLLGFSLLLVGSSAAGKQVLVKDPEGKTIAVIFDCSSCEKGGSDCGTGVEEGFSDGARCGQCLMKANYGKSVPLPYDIRVFGHMKDENGEPVMRKFVRLYMPRPWSFRTRTSTDGMFVVSVGATGERKGKEPIAVDLGDLTVRKDQATSTYALFMLPESYKPCEAGKKPPPED